MAPTPQADDPRPPFEDELKSVTIADFLRTGRELDPFSNWVLAGAGAVLFFVFDKYGRPDAPFGPVASVLVVVPLVISIGAGFLARYLSLQGLLLARQRDRHPTDVERILDKYNAAYPDGPPLRVDHVTSAVERFFPSGGLPAPLWLKWPIRVMDRLVGAVLGSNASYVNNLDQGDRGFGIAAFGMHRTLPLVVAQMFFLIFAVIVALAALTWSMLRAVV